MKLKLLGIALLFPMAAFASNTVTFFGEVADATCDVTVNGGAGDVSILLPTVQTTDLDAKGKVAGATPFNFTISGCQANGAETKVAMRLVPTFATNEGNLDNIVVTDADTSTTKADNVTLQILDSTGAINFESGEYVTTPTLLTAGAPGSSIDVPLTVQYYATGAATVGKVKSQLQYALSYE